MRKRRILAMRGYANVEEFVEAYRAAERICVFTGAGVSYTQDERYRAPGWKQLLRDILIELLGDSRRNEAELVLSGLETSHENLWDLASAVKSCATNDESFLQALRRAVLRENESVDSYGRLKAKNLRGATTLNAVVAFCSRVRELRTHPCFEVDPKIEAVLTANYDWFLEAGATAKHQAYRFKPMTRPSSALRRGSLPVYHIHGYLPYGKPKARGATPRQKPTSGLHPTEPLILDREGYESAYRPGSWTLDILERYVRSHTTVFIGFSFEDRYLRRELLRFSKAPQAPFHFALMRRDDDRPSGLLDELVDARVRPILYEDHCQIPQILAQAYQSALPAEGVLIPRKGLGRERFSPEMVWKMLWEDKRWKNTGNCRTDALAAPLSAYSRKR
jgi:SIR2-like domain